jgi:NodT family efflux transporter outer membrane factor (OMF) lipoprotein
MRARLLSLLPLLAGCTVGPDYHPPDMATPANFAAQNAPMSVPASDQTDMTGWWSAFHDAELDSLIARALDANLDLKSAASRIAEARQAEIIAGAAGLPNLSAMGNVLHLHSGTNPLAQLSGSGSSSGGGAPASSGGTDATLYALGFDASWEIDLFGGVRRGVEAAQAGTEAARWQMRDGEVTLIAELATDYVGLRSAQARLVLLQSELASQNDVLSLVSSRAKTGFVTQLDVNQQYALRVGTQAQIPPLEAQARTLEHAIAVLLAAEPDALVAELDKPAPVPDIPARLPVGLPSDLPRRRPDVREAAPKLAQATANQGVAVAALYPKFNLTGLVNMASSSLGSLFNSSSLSEVAVGMINWPIFSSGKGEANVHAKEEESRQAYLAYQKAVLMAVQDSEDALVRYAAEQRRYQALEEALARDRSSLTIAGQQYRAGLTTYINVLTAESSELQANDQLAQSKEALAANLAALYKALGGGWREDEGASAPG